MSDLLERVIAAHGGLARWRKLTTVQATIVTGGALWGMKSLVQDPAPRTMTVWLQEERASVMPFGAPDQRTAFTPERIAIEKTDGTIVAERLHPRESFKGHQQTTPWDPFHRAYFNGYALWTYLTTPFLLAMPGVEVHEVAPFTEGKEVWRRLRARFPAHLATHSEIQDFFFGEDLMLRRHDYSVDVAGGFLLRSMCMTMSKPTVFACRPSGAHSCVGQMTELSRSNSWFRSTSAISATPDPSRTDCPFRDWRVDA